MEKPEPRGSRSLGGVVAAVVLGTILALVSVGLQSGVRVKDERIDRVISWGRAVGAVALPVATGGGDREAIARAVAALQREEPSVRFVAVVKEEVEGAGGGGGSALDDLFSSLAGKEILASSDASLVGKSLSNEDAADSGALVSQARIFRQANDLKDHIKRNIEARATPGVTTNPYPEVSVEVTGEGEADLFVMVPVKADGKLVATVTLLARPERTTPGNPLVPILLAALVVLGIGIGLERLKAPGLPVLGLLFVAPVVIFAARAYDETTVVLEATAREVGETVSAVWAAGGGDGAAGLVAALNLDERGEVLTRFEATAGGLEVAPEAFSADAAARWWPTGVVALGILGVVALFWTGRAQAAYQAFVDYWFAYAYIGPTMAGMLLLVFGPFCYGLGLAFFERSYGEFQFVGLGNFGEILGSLSVGSGFYRTLGVTVLWTGVNVVLHVSIGLGLALLLKDKSLFGTAWYRSLLIVPWAVPNYITALIWKGMFNKEFGAINAFLGLFGVEPISWFDTFWKAFFANVATNTWLGFPFMMVVSLGALQSIPADLYEAADVDGANRWDKFRYITLPLLRPALFPAIILGIIWTFNMFNVIYLVSGGGPDGQTDILITEAYRWAFEQGRYGYAAAYSTIIFFILLSYTLVTNRMTRATAGAYE